MKICALTMVYRDYWALSRWHAHHARLLGAQNLFIVAHGADPRIAEICPGSSILTIARDDLSHFDKRRGAMLNGFHAGLAQIYDWVIRLDADELLCFDPDRHKSLAALFSTCEAPVLTALGFDVVERSEDPPLSDSPVLSQRRNLAFTGHYSKAVVARRPQNFSLHGTRVPKHRLQDFPFLMPRGLYLAHLKFANRSALSEGTRTRMEVGQGEERGLPGTGWSQADRDAQKFFETFEAKPEQSWEQAEERAFTTLSTEPSRIETRNIVKARALKFPFRTRLPQSFSAQG